MSGTVMVGLDGSAASMRALTWAADFALATDRSLRLVHVWHPDVAEVYVSVPDPHHDGELAARATAEKWLADVTPDPAAPWTLEVLEGSAGPRLVAAAEDEDDCVLVVGTHEHHGLGRVLHGSVSHYVLSHTECPVVAVPAPLPERIPTYADLSVIHTEVLEVPRF